jgi:hypothetical protein
MTTTSVPHRPRGGRTVATVLTFGTLAALTLAELRGADAAGAGPGRATTLAGLLMLKVGLVLTLCLRADFRRRSASRLVPLGLIFAAGAAAVLMLEAAFQARLR